MHNNRKMRLIIAGVVTLALIVVLHVVGVFIAAFGWLVYGATKVLPGRWAAINEGPEIPRAGVPDVCLTVTARSRARRAATAPATAASLAPVPGSRPRGRRAAPRAATSAGSSAGTSK